MKKIKISVPEESFDTLNTKYPADSNNVSNDSLTAGTKNIETSVKGVITKRKGGVVYSTLPNPPRDQYEAIFSDGVRHLLTVDNGNLRYTSGDGNETLVLAGLSANLNFEFATTQDKVYFGNGIQKKVYDKITSYGGVSYTFPTQTVKDMGAAAPSSAPTVAVAAGGSVPVGNHTYKVTFVYYDSEESNGGTASSVATTTAGNQTVNLTAIPVGGYGVTQRKIYRDDNNNVYTFVGVINNNTGTTFSDTIAAGLTPLPDDQGLPPDFTLITLFLDKLFLAGISGDPYTVFYSDTGMPDVFPALNYITCNQEDPITGLVVYLDRLIVFNRRSMGQILGKTSDQFRYADIQGSVGCVDNRSIQIRVIDGVPVLVWLSDKGFYAYNGNSIIYISDVIEDQINSNIQQSVIQKNRISHSDYASFTAGTKTNGINLEANQGTITTKGPYWDTVAHPGATYDEQTNPKKIWDTESEWETFDYSSQCATNGTSEKIKGVTAFNPVISAGTFDTVILDGGEVKLPTTLDFNGETSATSGSVWTWPRTAPSGSGIHGYSSIAVPFIPTRSGQLTSVCAKMGPGLGTTWGGHVTIHADVAGSPSEVPLTTSYTMQSTSTSCINPATFSSPPILTGGVKYWIVFGDYRTTGGPGPYGDQDIGSFTTGSTISGGNSLNHEWYQSGPYIYNTDWRNIDGVHPWISYSFVHTPTASSGSWTSTVYDTGCSNWDTGRRFEMSFTGSGWPWSWTVLQFQAQASNDPTFATYTTPGQYQQQYSPQYFYYTGNYRYWRFRCFLSTTDNAFTAAFATVTIKFSENSSYYPKWESEVIDTTADSTVYNALTVSSTIPSGTSLTTQIATSASPTGPWTGSGNGDGQFGTFGSHIVRQYAKIRFVFNLSATQSQTPTVNSLLFSWTVLSTFTSSAIDTAVDPSGWEVFQASSIANGGTVQFAMKSATTSGGLAGATWYNVTNGEFPTSSLPTLQWVQWKVTITSNPDQIPTVASVTIGWFVGTASQGIRCASLFYDKNYYVALAEFEEDTNNLLYVLDFTGKWRLFKDLNIATLSYFFNSPYYGDAVSGNIVKFLEGPSDQGNSIELDVRTKAFDGSTQWTDYDDKIKVLDHVILSVTNTGATFDCHYSVDEGMTFNPLYDTSGNNSWVTLTDGREVKKYLRPRYTVSIPQGRTLLFKIHNNDIMQVQLSSIKAEAFVREQPPIITG